MPFNWIDFLTLAQNLAANGDAASKRTAMSRAYYCIFHLAYARAVANCGPKPAGVTTHAWCWDKFTTNAACSALGTEGDRLKRLRHKADYDSHDITRLDVECARMIADVQQLHADLSALAANLP
jgi:hypothetical protein